MILRWSHLGPVVPTVPQMGSGVDEERSLLAAKTSEPEGCAGSTPALCEGHEEWGGGARSLALHSRPCGAVALARPPHLVQVGVRSPLPMRFCSSAAIVCLGKSVWRPRWSFTR